MNEVIKIEKTPKLGSMKETIDLVRKIAKESLDYRAVLAKESARFFLNSTKKAMKVTRLVEGYLKKDEAVLASPDISFRGKTYWVLRFGPQLYKLGPSRNFPTGYLVFTDENKVLQNSEQCRALCRLYRIWEEFDLRPLKVTHGKTILAWSATLKKAIFESVSERRLKGYDELEGSDEEKQALKELDDEVFTFYETEVELVKLEERLIDLRPSIFEHPSDKNIDDLMQLIYRFKKLLPIQEDYLRRRLTAWQKYRHLLERKFKIGVNLDFKMIDIGLAAFMDLMKYVLFRHTIPEAVLTEVAWEATKSVAEAKIAQSMMNLLVHYGGLASLNAQVLAHENLKRNLDSYTQIWSAEIPPEMIRL